MGRGWTDVEPDVVVWIDAAAFDEAWRETDQYIVPGGANGQDRRYARAGEWFMTHDYSDMLCVSWSEAGVLFTDGRHRFSWLRDQGVLALPMQVSPESFGPLRERFESPVRETRLTSGTMATP